MIKYQHIRPYYAQKGKGDNKNGVITIAYNIRMNDNGFPLVLEFAVSFCSPRDTFSKKIGREFAYNRLMAENQNFYRSIPLYPNRKLKHHEISDLIVANIFDTMELPRWALERF